MNEKYNCTEIIPNLWIGDLTDASLTEQYHDFERVINVLNIVEPVNGFVKVEVLDALSVIIDEALKNKCERILVHCGAGIERSSLVVAWYLSTKLNMPLRESYKLIQSKRGHVQNRECWVNWEIRKIRKFL
jgi:protein-tyrosine phosphatase